MNIKNIYNSHRIIHNELRKHTPEGVKKAKKIVSFKCQKLLLLIFLIALAYYIFTRPFISEIIYLFDGLDYFGIFVSGILMNFGASMPFGLGLLMNIHPENILFGALLGGIGAAIADILIFRTVKWSFTNEFNKLKETKGIKHIEEIIKKNKHVIISHYLLYIFAGIILITPLPDEIGVSMLAGLTTINQAKLAVLSFLLHGSAIFFILYFI